MTERKCCNCCLYATAVPSPPRREKIDDIDASEGRIVCKAKWGSTESPYWNKNFYFTRRPCMFFKLGCHNIYGIDDDDFYLEWLRARINRMSIKNVSINVDGYLVKGNRLHMYDELLNHLQYHKQFKKYPRKPRDAYSKYGKVL